MSGHSKWENIKRQKGKQDRARAKVFGKLSNLITTAVHEGDSDDPESNVQLRQVIERAKEENMPKENIQRAIENASKSFEEAEEVFLEAYGQEGVAILIQGLTDNRQRTVQEVKFLIDRHGGSLAEPGAVAYQFKKIGEVTINDPGQDKLLSLLDMEGILNFEEKGEEIKLTVLPSKLGEIQQKLSNQEFKVIESGLNWQAKNQLEVNKTKAQKDLKELLSKLKDRIDVKKVFTNWEEQN